MPLSCRRPLAVLLVTAVLGSGGAAYAAGDAARGKELSYTCLGCHGIENYKNVYPTYSVPELVGQHPEYLIAALKEYRSGERSHGTMHVQAASLSDQDIEDIALYFAGPVLKSTTTMVGTPPPKVAQLCVACHGKDGVGIMGDYPTLAGQHADYLARALVEYQKGDRKNAVMPSFMTGVTEQEIREIAEYYSQQSPPLHTEPRRVTILSAQ
ncbi:MAG TPA: c-type cytochrome [Steroidobacteraceae bacterium]